MNRKVRCVFPTKRSGSSFPKQFEELPSGEGYADLVFLPKRTCRLPALIVELKYDRSAEGAIAQIKKKQYASALSDYGGDILLVGINYRRHADANGRHHTCIIERCKKE